MTLLKKTLGLLAKSNDPVKIPIIQPLEPPIGHPNLRNHRIWIQVIVSPLILVKSIVHLSLPLRPHVAVSICYQEAFPYYPIFMILIIRVI